MQNNYGLEFGLVDVNGQPHEKDFDNQADMCEIVRALIANGKIEGVSKESIGSLTSDVADKIDCAGETGIFINFINYIYSFLFINKKNNNFIIFKISKYFYYLNF